MLPGNIFGLILKNKMAARDVYSTLNKDFCCSFRAKGIMGRDIKFTGYVPHYKILTGNVFGLILKNKMAAKGISLSVMKSAYISLLLVLEPNLKVLSACLLTKNAVYLLNYVSWPLSVDTSSIWPQMRP